MGSGFDTTENCFSYGQEIVDSGYTFAGRYYFSGISHVKTKLTYKEAKHLSVMGVYLVAVFENASDHAGYFSYSQGVADGSSAYTYASGTIKQPDTSPVYFTVDYDASEVELQERIIPYFKGVREHRGDYFVGVYGSGFVCRRLLELGLVHFTWVAQSTGWRESKQFKNWNLKQGKTTTLFGIEVDLNQSNDNGGEFKVE